MNLFYFASRNSTLRINVLKEDRSKVRQVDLLTVTKSPLILTFPLSNHFHHFCFYFFFYFFSFHPLSCRRHCRLSSSTFLFPDDIILFQLGESRWKIENATQVSSVL